MYKSIPADIRQIKLDADLYKLHKHGAVPGTFGMDNTPALLDNGFGLYSSAGLPESIGPVKTEYFRIALTRAGQANFKIGLENYQSRRNYILFGIPGQIFSVYDISTDFLVYYMLFSEQFISDPLSKLNQKYHFPFLSYSGLQCFELADETANEVESIIFKMNDEIKINKSECSDIIRLYIQLILINGS